VLLVNALKVGLGAWRCVCVCGGGVTQPGCLLLLAGGGGVEGQEAEQLQVLLVNALKVRGSGSMGQQSNWLWRLST
jgi:hypothetical protein